MGIQSEPCIQSRTRQEAVPAQSSMNPSPPLSPFVCFFFFYYFDVSTFWRFPVPPHHAVNNPKN